MSSTHYGVLSAVARAQLKKVVEGGDLFCVEYDHYGSDKRSNTRQRECRKCWESLKKEAGIE